MSDSFWKGRRVLIDGADGFIGSHLTERLVREGACVRALCFYNSDSSWGWLDKADPEIKKELDVVLGDIRDARFVNEACDTIDTVFHLAALIAIPYSYKAPESFVDTNVKGTLNILEAVRRAGCRRLVHTSTSEVYGTPDSVPILETHPLQGQSPYSATKIAADKLCEAYHSSYSLPVVVLRPFNTYGPRQSARAVIPTIIVQLLAGRMEVRLGNLAAKRDLTYVSDTVEGFLSCAEMDNVEGEVIQLGTGRELSIGELFETACKILGKETRVVQDKERLRPEASEVAVLLSDPSKARRILGWEAKTSIEEGLLLTAEWFKERPDVYDPNRYYI